MHKIKMISRVPIICLLLCLFIAGCIRVNPPTTTGFPTITNPAHKKRTMGLAISPDGTIIATGSLDGTVKVWSATNSPKVIDLSAGEIWSLSFSPDGSKLFIGADKCLALYSTSKRRLLWRKAIKALSVDVDFSHKGDLVAIVRYEGHNAPINQIVEIARSESGDSHTTFTSPDPELSCVRFLSDGVHIIASGRKGAYLWNLKTGKMVNSVSAKGGASFALSPQDDLLAIGNYDEFVSLIALQDNTVVHRLNLCGGGYSDYPVAFSPDGGLIATGFGGIIVWDSVTGQPLVRFTNDLTCNVVFSPDGKWLISSQDDGFVKKWALTEVKHVSAPSRIMKLRRDKVLLVKDEGDWEEPIGLFPVDKKLAEQSNGPYELYRAALYGDPSVSNFKTLIAFSHIFSHRKGGMHIKSAEVLKYVLHGNHLIVRVKYIYDYSTGYHAPFEYWYVKIPLPTLDSGSYHASVSFDEYKDGSYYRPAAETVFTRFDIKGGKGVRP